MCSLVLSYCPWSSYFFTSAINDSVKLTPAFLCSVSGRAAAYIFVHLSNKSKTESSRSLWKYTQWLLVDLFARDVAYWCRCRAHMGYVLYRALMQVDNQSTDQEACKLNLWGQANHANAACPVINVLFKLRCSYLEFEKKLQKKWILTICWPLLGDSLTSTRPLPCRGWSWWMPHVDWNSAVSLLSACWHVSIQLVSLWIHLLHWRLYFGWYVLKILHSVQVLWLHILFSVPPYSVFTYTE